MCSPCLFFRTILTECNFHALSLTRQNIVYSYLSCLLLKIWLPSEERGRLCCERHWEDLFRLRLLDELLGSSRWFSERGISIIFWGMRSIVLRLLLCYLIHPTSYWWLISVSSMFIGRGWGVSEIWLSYTGGLLIQWLVDGGVILLRTKPVIHCNLLLFD